MIGIFDAKIIEYGTTPIKDSGSPQIWVEFEYQVDGGVQRKKWFSGFTGGQRDITEKALLAMGLQPQNFDKLANFMHGVASNLLDLNTVYSIDIQEEPDYKDPSKMVAKIKWVNNPAMAPQTQKIDEASSAQYFGSMDFAVTLSQKANEMGLTGNGGQAMNQNMNQGQGFNNQNNAMTNGQGMNQNQGYNQNQNQNMNQQQNFNQNQQQNMNQGQNFNQQNNMNQGQGQQGGAGFKAPF